MHKRYLVIVSLLFSFCLSSTSQASEILTQDSVKTLMSRFQTVLNSSEKSDKDLFFKYFADNNTRVILNNYLLNPEDTSIELASENVTLTLSEFSKYLDSSRKKDYYHIYVVETGEAIIDSKTKTGIVGIAIGEFGLRRQQDPKTGARIHDMTVLASTNCNVSVADNTNEVVITSFNCIGKIVEDPKPTSYTSSTPNG